MTWLSEFFYKPCTLPCPDCKDNVSISNLSHHMGIVGIEGCEWEVFVWGFVNAIEVECKKCHNVFKVSGVVYDGPTEGYLNPCLKLIPKQA